jgi:hypothetical protein
MVAHQFDRLGDELTFILPTGTAILPPQLEKDFGFGLLAHKIVHPLGNTDFWRNDPFAPSPRPHRVTIFLAQIGHFFIEIFIWLC